LILNLGVDPIALSPVTEFFLQSGESFTFISDEMLMCSIQVRIKSTNARNGGGR
jgi:hypothetical protein